MIEACKLNGVKNLIYVSDVTVVKDLNSIIKGTEGTTCYPANHLHLDGWSKCEAEKLVLSANGDPLGQGQGYCTVGTFQFILDLAMYWFMSQ